MMQRAWEQAFPLMAGHGQMGTCQIMASGVEDAASVEEQYRR
jgi:hypothetical protein